MADFSFKSDPNILASILAAPKEEADARAKTQALRQQRLSALLDQLQQVGQTVSHIPALKAQSLANEAAASKMQGEKKLSQLLADANKPEVGPQPMAPYAPQTGEAQPQLPQPQPSPLMGQTPGYLDQIKSAVQQSNPQAFAQQAAEKYFSEKQPAQEKLQSKQISFNGTPVMAGYNPVKNKYFDNSGNELVGDIKPYGSTSALAEVRKQSLINSINQKLPEVINPSRFGPNTVVGKAANVVQSADSYLGQVENVLTGKTIPDKEIMTALAIDAARTLTQTGVVSEQTINELIPQSLKGKFRDWQSYITNAPTGKDQLDFIKNLSTEVRRQRDIKQSLIDNTIGGNIPSLNVLKRLSPQDWEAGLAANGLDVNEARKGHYKLRPDVLSAFYGSAEIPGVTTAGVNAGGTDLGGGFSYTVKP